MEPTTSLLHVSNDILSLITDRYLDVTTVGKLARVNKRLYEVVSKHPLFFLARYILAFHANAVLPSQTGMRWNAVTQIPRPTRKQLEKIDPGFRAYHQFLSENHDFKALHSLQLFVSCILCDMKWIASSLAHTAQNEKIKRAAKSYLYCFYAISSSWTAEVINNISWNNLSLKARLLTKYGLHSLQQMVAFKVYASSPRERCETVFNNWQFAVFLIKSNPSMKFFNKILPVLKKEFPEKGEQDLLKLEQVRTLALEQSLKSHKHKIVVEAIGKDTLAPTTPAAFIDSLKHYSSFEDLCGHYPGGIPFKDEEDVIKALHKRFNDYSLPFASSKNLILSAVRYRVVVHIRDELKSDCAFLLKVVEKNPKMLTKLMTSEDEVMKRAFILNPWLLKHFYAETKRKYWDLFISLIPPQTVE